jgi:hypothetical protein
VMLLVAADVIGRRLLQLVKRLGRVGGGADLIEDFAVRLG